MNIIAKTTNGVIIEATESEIKEIMKSVNGETPKELNIGQKIPAIDYAQSIKDVKELNENYRVRELKSEVNSFVKSFESLMNKIDTASNLDLN